MNHTEFGWKNQQENQIFAQLWTPPTPPTAMICLVHGYGEHSNRYGYLVKALTEAGYGVITHDHQGHGRSEGRRGDVSSYNVFLDDVDRLLAEAAQRFPQTPQFLYGHSMGANVVLNYVLRRQPAIVGVIATSPWLRLVNPPSALMRFLIRITFYLWPSFTRPTNMESGSISRDPVVLNASGQNDPLGHDLISVRMFTFLDGAGQWALDHAHEFSLPLLHMHGTADRVTSVAASQEFIERVSCDHTFKLWDGYYHETHNDLGRQEVFEFVINWLATHTSANVVD